MELDQEKLYKENLNSKLIQKDDVKHQITMQIESEQKSNFKKIFDFTNFLNQVEDRLKTSIDCILENKTILEFNDH